MLDQWVLERRYRTLVQMNSFFLSFLEPNICIYSIEIKLDRPPWDLLHWNTVTVTEYPKNCKSWQTVKVMNLLQLTGHRSLDVVNPQLHLLWQFIIPASTRWLAGAGCCYPATWLAVSAVHRHPEPTTYTVRNGSNTKIHSTAAEMQNKFSFYCPPSGHFNFTPHRGRDHCTVRRPSTVVSSLFSSCWVAVSIVLSPLGGALRSKCTRWGWMTAE